VEELEPHINHTHTRSYFCVYFRVTCDLGIGVIILRYLFAEPHSNSILLAHELIPLISRQ
jgi:hypothetical protein